MLPILSHIDIRSRILLIIGVIILMLVTTMWFSLNTVNQLKYNLNWQVHCRIVTGKLLAVNNEVITAETSIRGFVITGDTNYVSSYRSSKQRLPVLLAELRNAVADNPMQDISLDSMQKLITRKMDRLDTTLSYKLNGNEAAIKRAIQAKLGQKYMDQIKSLNTTMLSREEWLYGVRADATAESMNKAGMIFLIEGIFSLIITFFLTITILRELNARDTAEKKLSLYNAELLRKNNEIEQFAYISAHDLQEPLRSISNFSGLLSAQLEKAPDSPSKIYVNKISAAANRMSKLIFDLLEYSRLGKETVRNRVDCNVLITEVLLDLNKLIKETGAHVNYSGLPVIEAYPGLKSLFQNLITNAIKFAKKGVTPEVKIEATQNTNEYIFSVSDNGIGIEKEYFEKIFIIFQRLHTRDEYPGSGIGLAQCKKIVEMHGGRIWVNSIPGEGTTFSFTIPKNRYL